MFNSVILDVAIGLAFTYLLLALICTTANEWLSSVLKTRGKMLERGIAGLLGGQMLGATKFLDAFNAHSLIAGLRKDPNTPPSYMAARTFALTVMDLLTPPGSITFADLETGIGNLPAGCVKTSLLAVIQNANGDLAKAQTGIENWFNDAMDRVSGWFTRHKQWMSVALAVGITLFVNADTLSMANKLWVNPTLRQEIVAKAPTQNPSVSALTNEMGDLAGWANEFSVQDHGSWKELAENSVAHIPGWLLTIAAVSLGAPFWFDLLSKFMSVRASGKNPAESD